MSPHGIRRLLLAGSLASTLIAVASGASDHADPMSLNVFAVQQQPDANITDLHAFVVDRDGRRVTSGDALAPDHRLVVSLCVRRALRPDQTQTLDLAPYTFRIHLDLGPPVRFAGDGGVATSDRDRSMQALYGGIIAHPEDIVDTAVLEFDLHLAHPDVAPYVVLDASRAWGFREPARLETLPATPKEKRDKALHTRETWYEVAKPPAPGTIAITVALFDDPFIFPRFFRRNVVGIVASIPLSSLPLPARMDSAPILLWATTHQGSQQIDHVGRSLRTQLPRFGYLNDKHPGDHVREITRVHAEPTIEEALLGSIIAPLFAHRHYDSVPDVMIYDLRKPAAFPNGRWLEDDVAATLAAAGEPLLWELSYAESRQFPRAAKNDKAFLPTFPYLAAPWDADQIAEANAGTAVPGAPDASAIAPPTFDNSIWRRLFWIEVAAIGVLTVLLFRALRSTSLRAVLVLGSLLVVGHLVPVRDDNILPPAAGAAEQPMQKLADLGVGLALIASLALGWIFTRGRRSVQGMPQDRQGPMPDDIRTRSYAEIVEALFDPTLCRPYYKVWGDAAEDPLPIYETTFASVMAGWISAPDMPFAMERAARRTLRSRGDLRWGEDSNGFRRLVHPMGVCLEGTWKIDAAPPLGRYTGYFAPGKEGRVIARYSVGGNHAQNGNYRSLGLVGKLFPPQDAPAGDTPRAHFITQEDLGGAFTNSVTEAELTNSPPVTLWKRGSGLPAFLGVVLALTRSDAEPAERQLYEIAELEKPDVATRCPRFMRLKLESPPPAAGARRLDFRDEILGMIYDAGDPRPKREIVFKIEVSDEGERVTGVPNQRVVGQRWVEIGSLTFRKALASWAGDFVVHFHHPVWRQDRNDPTSVQRPDLRRPGA
ncbi:MAG TPA: hypothetical protein VFY49_06300 [Myxococcota bacterium]|nr:hypothetical protein [Myxococcota bacterium]